MSTNLDNDENEETEEIVEIKHNAGDFRLIIEAHEQMKNLLFDKSKGKENIQSCLNDRLVDGFLLSAARAAFYLDKPENLPGSKRIINVMNLDKLKDNLETKWMYFVIQLIGYYHKIREAEAKKDDVLQTESHHILANLTECRKITEQYFHGNWVSLVHSFHKKILENDIPDCALYDEIEEILRKAEEQENAEKEQLTE